MARLRGKQSLQGVLHAMRQRVMALRSQMDVVDGTGAADLRGVQESTTLLLSDRAIGPCDPKRRPHRMLAKR